jgi:hypothetical protein
MASSPSDDDGAVSARNSFVFFALSTLEISLVHFCMRKLKEIICFRLSIEAVNMLKEYFFSVVSQSYAWRGIEGEEYLALLSALQ